MVGRAAFCALLSVAACSTSSNGGATGTSSSGQSSSTGAIAGSTTGSTSGSSSGGITGSSGGSGGSTGTTTGGHDGGCEPANDGGACTTAADCVAALVCTSLTCEAPPPAPTSCVADSEACSFLKPCCGICLGGTCSPLKPCGMKGGGCSASTDCCARYVCSFDAGTSPDGGTCTGTCGGSNAPCKTNADCCTAEGLVCRLAPTGTSGLCGLPSPPTTPNPGCGPAACTAGPDGQCLLGSACNPTTVPDPCSPSGLVCDSQTMICRQPLLFEPCLPGGPSCNQRSFSNAAISCVEVDGGHSCQQLCASTSECVSLTEACEPLGSNGGICGDPFAAMPCSTAFGHCTLSPGFDGVCLLGTCFQTATDGGGEGAACRDWLYTGSGSRQNGDSCNFSHVCLLGLCDTLCNSGTGASPGCPNTRACVNDLGDPAQADSIGVCTLPCDYTSPDGGGCGRAQGGPPQKCVPRAFVGAPDAPTGICVAAMENPITPGLPCDPNSIVDQCGAGSGCVIPNSTLVPMCLLFCSNIGAACSGGGTCLAFNSGGTSGFCF
jgi:hypothetical protein